MFDWLVNYLQAISPQGPVRPGAPTPAPSVAQLPSPVPPKVPQSTVPQSTVPGAQKLPRPTMRPDDLLGMLFGPSMSPSQEGMWYSPSQGPGEAVTQPDMAPKMPPVSAAIQAPEMASGGSAPTAPAPPGPSRMAPGALTALLGGQNPLAATKPPVLELLSRLLGGR